MAYSGTNATTPVASFTVFAAASSTTSVTSPAGSAAASGDWVVSYWAAKSSTVTAWTVPGSVTSRGADNGTGSGRINSVVGDSGTSVPIGAVGGLTATTDVTPGAVDSWTIVLKP